LGLMEKGGMYSAFYKMQFRENASKNLISENKEIACYILQDVTKTTVGDISRNLTKEAGYPFFFSKNRRVKLA